MACEALLEADLPEIGCWRKNWAIPWEPSPGSVSIALVLFFVFLARTRRWLRALTTQEEDQGGKDSYCLFSICAGPGASQKYIFSLGPYGKLMRYRHYEFSLFIGEETKALEG